MLALFSVIVPLLTLAVFPLHLYVEIDEMLSLLTENMLQNTILRLIVTRLCTNFGLKF